VNYCKQDIVGRDSKTRTLRLERPERIAQHPGRILFIHRGQSLGLRLYDDRDVLRPITIEIAVNETRTAGRVDNGGVFKDAFHSRVNRIDLRRRNLISWNRRFAYRT